MGTKHVGELGELDRVLHQLEELARALASGTPEPVREQAEQVQAGIAALERLERRVRESHLASTDCVGQPLAEPTPADVMQRLVRIRSQTARIAEMVVHGEQVCAGMAAVLALLYGAHAGAQYSASGAPSLPNLPRLMAQG